MADSLRHIWYTPSDIANVLNGTQHGETWRAVCPAHHGDNTHSLSIREGTDKYGHPCTLLHCFAHHCTVEEICTALDLTMSNLFCMEQEYARSIRNAPRARSPRIARLKFLREATPDDFAQVMLEEMIVSDPQFLAECIGARETFWRLAQDPSRQKPLFRALADAKLPIQDMWRALQHEQEDTHA